MSLSSSRKNVYLIINLCIDNAISIIPRDLIQCIPFHFPPLSTDLVLRHHFPKVWWMGASCPGNASPSSQGTAGGDSQETAVRPQEPRSSGDLRTRRRKAGHTFQGFQILNTSSVLKLCLFLKGMGRSNVMSGFCVSRVAMGGLARWLA